ncbi:MAG: hypothetical protein QME93_07875 [Bacillota bacterium]|nr:hypothetical protein [Bacillota bacterium]MDI7249971.1 hypothetical protein [Bacillota bacterium]
MRLKLRWRRAAYVLCMAGALALAVVAGRWAASEAGRLAAARAEASKAAREAAALASREAKREAAREDLLRAAEPLARDAEAGTVLRFLERAARDARVRVTLAEAAPRVEKVWKGHFRAVPWKLEAVGSGEGVQAFLCRCEALPYPGEVRVFSLQADESPGARAGQVKLSCLLLLYCTDPPLQEDLLSAGPPRADVWSPPASWVPPVPPAPGGEQFGEPGEPAAPAQGAEKGSGPR